MLVTAQRNSKHRFINVKMKLHQRAILSFTLMLPFGLEHLMK